MKEAEAAIGDTYRMLDELSGRLSSATRVQSFPDLADGFTRAVEIETRLLEVRQLLVDAQFGEVSGSMSKKQKKEWSTLVDELDELKKKVSEIPQGRDKLASRQREVVAEFERLRRRLDETSYELESQRAQLRGINKYLGDELRPLTKAERAEVTKARDELTVSITAMSDLHKKLSIEVELLRESIGDADPVRVAENELQSRYRSKLGDAEAYLNAAGSGGDVETARLKIDRVQRALDGFFRGLDEIAGEAVGGLSSDVDAQRTLADQHRESLQQLVTASQTGAGVAAYVNFMQARAEYTEIVLRGEVGIMDVVWQKKEDMTNKISKLFEDRTSELNLLQEAFEEVR
jgi:chromosome segregation ATPase